MDERSFFKAGEIAGFTREQLSFLWAHLAQKGHTHTSDQVVVDSDDGETLEDYIDYMDNGPEGDESQD